MKKLICVKDVEDLNIQGKNIFYIDRDTIITPSAMDAAEALGIEFLEEEQECKEEISISDLKKLDNDQIYQVLKILMERGLFDTMLKPYNCESHSNGLKVVRGNSVQMDVFDTGNPETNVSYQELIHKNESHMNAGVLVIDHSRFGWKLDYEEIDYIIEGTLQITIDDKVYTATAGDVLYVPSGSEVVWESPDRAKMFYITY